MATRSEAVRESGIRTVTGDLCETRADSLAIEEPLEIRLVYGPNRRERPISVTMRTPGDDRFLAAGFLHSEQIITSPRDILTIGPESDHPKCNVVRVELRDDLDFDVERLQRNFYTTSSCGVCSKASLEALQVRGCPLLTPGLPQFSPDIVRSLPGKLQAAQTHFSATGGLHAAGLFDSAGQLISLHEDVGRHNAVDKVIGEQFVARRLPLSDSLLMVSGRTSFEIMQKALVAGIPVVAAVSAPSTLAVLLARQFRMSLLGFVRGGRFNVYADFGRLKMTVPG